MKNFNIVYKINSIQNIINTQHALIEKIYILKKNDKTINLIKQCKEKNIKTYYIKKINQTELNYIKKNYNVIAKIKKITTPNLTDIINKNYLSLKILILDRVQDPHNLSSCIRTSEAFSINLIVTSKKHTTKISSLVNSLSNGASILVPIIEENNITHFIKYLKKQKIKIIGLSAKAKDELNKEMLSSPIAIIMGSEKDGIKKELKNECDEFLKIKMNNANKSINLSVATGIVLSKIQN
ncbi:MAG TPA: 23S rRNA (guanosine(2251)-2'-O)-methyltransferase RlmB [Candidatus Azoamicus sp.]